MPGDHSRLPDRSTSNIRGVQATRIEIWQRGRATHDPQLRHDQTKFKKGGNSHGKYEQNLSARYHKGDDNL